MISGFQVAVDQKKCASIFSEHNGRRVGGFFFFSGGVNSARSPVAYACFRDKKVGSGFYGMYLYSWMVPGAEDDYKAMHAWVCWMCWKGIIEGASEATSYRPTRIGCTELIWMAANLPSLFLCGYQTLIKGNYFFSRNE